MTPALPHPPLNPQTRAEHRLLECWSKSKVCILGDGSCPEPDWGNDDVTIRADFITQAIQFYPNNSEFKLTGGLIPGVLSLPSDASPKSYILEMCRFGMAPDFAGAAVRKLIISHCKLPGIDASHLHPTGDVRMEDCEVTGLCNFSYASFDGGLSLNRSAFTLPESGSAAVPDDPLLKETAVSLMGANIVRSLLANEIKVTGRFDLISARIGGQLSFDKATFGVRAERPDAHPPEALRMQQTRIGDALLWRKVTVASGRINLTRAETDVLEDDPDSWAACKKGLDLDGFRYNHIRGKTLGNVEARIAWLTAGTTGNGSFSSQPWRHFAHILRENGDDSAARKVMMERERLYIAHERHRMWARLCAEWRGERDVERSFSQMLRAKGRTICSLFGYRLHIIWSCLKRLIIGYGYDPKRPLYWSLGFILIGWLLSVCGWQAGVFAPSSDQILTSDDWLAAMAIDATAPVRHWLSSPSAQHYEEFSPFLFALDTYLPVMDLGQEKAWAVTTVTTPGTIGRALWVGLQAAGWIVTSLGIAAVAGLVQKGRDD